MPAPRKVSSMDWQPIGIDEMEVGALEAVYSTGNQLVVAGPGAGKTELLAQRATFLLQTGGSPVPQRILSISFKRDAATNLGERVRLRCHTDNADRFDSLTFDAFAKGLIDRFGQILPDRWRPRPDYEIIFPNHRTYRDFLEGLTAKSSRTKYRDENFGRYADTFERNYLIGSPLVDESPVNPSAMQWAADRFWCNSLHEEDRTYLSFPMIGRLVEFLLRSNPLLCDALKLTYSHLFMDEFQDTTQVQYDLVKTIFLGSDTIVTAVGDNKQQIMRWANAMERPFDVFNSDFAAKPMLLLNNYRSSPKLVQIQRVLAKALDPSAAIVESKTEGKIDGDSCAIWDFSKPENEAVYLADHIANSIKAFDLAPRDFVLLVRQKADGYARSLSPAFSEKGLSLCNEATRVGSVPLQDLQTEPVSHMLVLILRLATNERAGPLWGKCQKALSSIRCMDSDDEVALLRLSRELDFFCREFKRSYPCPVSSREEARKVVETIQHFIGRDPLIYSHPGYRQGDWFDKVTEATIEHLHCSAAKACDWAEALDTYEGTHSVPLMTIHKSKGLEYHTVILVGLDDNAWWSFPKNPTEGIANFFVAFSRAQQRIIFTYCLSRGDKNKVAPLYKLLKDAGVKSVSSTQTSDTLRKSNGGTLRNTGQ